MDGRWRGGGDGDGDNLPFNPRLDRVSEEELLLPELGFEEAAVLCNFFGKTIGGPSVFRSGEVNRRKERRRPSHHLARWALGVASPRPWPGGIWGYGWPPQSPFWLRGSSAKI